VPRLVPCLVLCLRWLRRGRLRRCRLRRGRLRRRRRSHRRLCRGRLRCRRRSYSRLCLGRLRLVLWFGWLCRGRLRFVLRLVGLLLVLWFGWLWRGRFRFVLRLVPRCLVLYLGWLCLGWLGLSWLCRWRLGFGRLHRGRLGLGWLRRGRRPGRSLRAGRGGCFRGSDDLDPGGRDRGGIRMRLPHHFRGTAPYSRCGGRDHDVAGGCDDMAPTRGERLDERDRGGRQCIGPQPGRPNDARSRYQYRSKSANTHSRMIAHS
jgi:hypothetical protein